MNTTRLEAFSDGVIAILITIMVLEMKTPEEMTRDENDDKNVISLDNYRWESHCRGLYKLPIAA